MAVIVGQFIGSALLTEGPDPPVADYPLGLDATVVIDVPSVLLGPDVTSTQPVDEPGTVKTGELLEGFAMLDFYNRIHISTLRIDLGNILSVQVREISIWNGFFVPHTLLSVSAQDDEGLTLTEPEPAPFALGPLEEAIYEVTVATEGPARVEALYTFELDVVTFEVEVLGVRIVAWSFEPNWINPVVERPEWLTRILKAYDGSEQRAAMRGGPRVFWEFTYDIKDDQRRTLENMIADWGARSWALPVWPDVRFLQSTLAPGADEILMDTAGLDYRVDGAGLLIRADATFEAFEVEEIQADRIILARPLLQTWTKGSRVYPSRSAILQDPRATERMTRNYERGIARFRTLEEIERPALEEEQYRGYPVLTHEFNWRETPDFDYQRKLSTVDFLVGRTEITDESECAEPVTAFQWTSLTRADADYFRRWLWAREGRCHAVWTPTWCEDLILASTLAGNSAAINFRACGLVAFGRGDVHRRDIRIQTKAGQVFYRRVTDPVTISDTIERMTMNTGIGIDVTPSEIERISWMHLSRLDQDQIELAWHTPQVVESVIVLRAPRNVV